MITGWTYRNNPFDDDLIPKGSIGFIYLMRHIPSGKKYIGRKLLTQSHTKQKNKKIIKSRIDSNWRDYWSSSPQILEMIKDEGSEHFTREILQFVSSKGMLVYAEELALYYLGALERDDWFNDNIRSKVYRNWCKPEQALQLRYTLEGIS